MMASNNEELGITTLRYVLYARKSTEDEGSQINSIEDQIRVCQDYAQNHSLRIVKVIREERSAKKFNNRPKFSKMLTEFPKKYDGIIAYHPDRIARNMRDAGIVIDMLNTDNSIIKNMAFPTVQYANDSSGRLTLAVLFSLATQFSEHLSEVVKRGVYTNFERGISSGSPKWGYVRNYTTGYYEKDENYEYIQKAWLMRAEGERIADIVKYLRNNGVQRKTKITRKNRQIRTIKPSETSLNRMFRDSFYYGTLVQTGQEIDLCKLVNFEPMIMEEIYNKVQDVGYLRSRLKPKANKQKIFYPFRNMVFCEVCHGKHPMRVGKNRSQTGDYVLTYRCDNPECQRKVKSVRAKYILEELYKILKTLKFTEKEYKQYSKRLDELTDTKLDELRTERRSLNGVKTNKEHQRDEWSRKLRDMDNKNPAYSVIENDILNLQNEIIDIEQKIVEINPKLLNSNKIKMTKDEFLNLANTAYDKMRAGSPVEKDILLRKLCLNLYINDERVPTFIWREPFATLIEMRKKLFGARERT